MKSTLAFLVVLQVLIGTLGQGALTLCVRRDGTQHLEWTALSDCKAEAARESMEHCCHEVEHAAIALSNDVVDCDPCTDYLVVADPGLVLNHKPVQLDDVVGLAWFSGSEVTLGQSSVCFAAYHGPPRAGPLLIHLSPVLRC